MSATDGGEIALSETERVALGRRIALSRKALGLTQEQVADALHVHKQSVWKWEKGAVGITLDNLRALATALRTTPTHLLGSPPQEDSHVAESATVTLSREDLGYLRGRLDTTVAWLASLDTSVVAIRDQVVAFRDQLEQATTNAREAVARVLPRPIPVLPLERMESSDEEERRRTG